MILRIAHVAATLNEHRDWKEGRVLANGDI